MQVAESGELKLTDAEGRLLQREEMRLTEDEAQMLRIAARMLRGKRFRMRESVEGQRGYTNWRRYDGGF